MPFFIDRERTGYRSPATARRGGHLPAPRGLVDSRELHRAGVSRRTANISVFPTSGGRFTLMRDDLSPLLGQSLRRSRR